MVNFINPKFVQTYYKIPTWQFKDDSDTKCLFAHPF
jgi:hypothetical protein